MTAYLAHQQTWLFSSTSTYHSTDPLTARGVALLAVHGKSGSTSYETIPYVRLETSGDVLSTVDMVTQRRDGPRWLRELDDDDIWHDKQFLFGPKWLPQMLFFACLPSISVINQYFPAYSFL